MTPITEAATRLKEICTRLGRHPAARGANDIEIEQIQATFDELEFPVPTGLLDVYRITLAIPGILNSEPILGAPCIFSGPPVGHITFLINQEDEADKEDVLWLGHGNTADLIINRDGQCALVPKFEEDGTITLVHPTDFEAAFLAYVRAHENELRAQFKET